MNVNVLKDNPEWWWFVIVSSIVLALTIVVWLGFKYGQVRPARPFSVAWKLN